MTALQVWVVEESTAGQDKWAVHDVWSSKKAAQNDAKAQRALAREFFAEARLRYRVRKYVPEGEFFAEARLRLVREEEP